MASNSVRCLRPRQKNAAPEMETRRIAVKGYADSAHNLDKIGDSRRHNQLSNLTIISYSRFPQSEIGTPRTSGQSGSLCCMIQVSFIAAAVHSAQAGKAMTASI